jgi:hypothetical protein
LQDIIVRLFIPIIVALILLSGCSEDTETGLITGEKFSDIKPMYKNLKKGDALFAEMVVYSIAISKDKIVDFGSIWGVLVDEKIVFKDKELFDKNGFRSALGNSVVWPVVRDKLLELDSGVSNTSVLKTEDGQTEKVPLRKLYGNSVVYYYGGRDQLESVTMGSGEVVLALKIEALTTVKGRVNVILAPAYLPDPRCRECLKHIFIKAGLSFDISPGEFLMLAPQQYPKSSSTLDGAVFKTVLNTRNDELLNVYIIACGRIFE